MGLEILTKLNPNRVDLEHVAGSGPALIDRDAICFALAGSSRAEFCLALLMFCGDEQSFSPVKVALFMAACELPEYPAFAKKNPRCLEDLCYLAIEEFVAQPVCKLCRGVGFDLQFDVCCACDGSGRKPLSLRKRMRRFNKSASSWYRFKHMFGLLMGILSNWNANNELRLRERLR